MKPLLSGGNGAQKITPVENDEIISDDKKIAETFNDFFIQAVSNLDLKENNAHPCE